MGGGKSGGAGSKTYDYFGTLCVPIRAGRTDNLYAVLIDGKAIWEGSINRSVGNPYTVPLSDPKWILSYGYLKIYWGLDNQTTPDPALVGHPPYRGITYAVLHKFLHGRERTAAPNIEFIVDAEARPDSSIIAATTMVDNCVNPWAVVVEILTSYNGLGFPVSRLNAASFQAAHDALSATSALKSLTYCAPIYTSQVEARRAISDILDICDGQLRWDKDGKLEAVQLDPNPGSLSGYTSLDSNALTDPPRIEAQSWDQVPTGCVVRWRDRERQWKESSVAIDDLRTLQTSGEARRTNLDRLNVNRRDQAMALGAEWVKRFCQPLLSGTISVRPSKAVNPSGTPLRPGDRFILDIDPEPGGVAVNQLCRVKNRRFGPTGPVEISWVAEPNQPTFVSTPSYTPPTQPDLDVPEITDARIITLPLSETVTPGVFALASRPGDLVTGFHVEFDVALGVGTFASIGVQSGFAVRGRLKADYSDTATGTIDFEVLDTRDEAFLADYVGGDSLAQNDDLLLIVYKTASGFIDEDSSNLPKLEVFSISSQATTAAQRYDLTTIRGRKGTIARSWNTNDEAWIVRGSSMIQHGHLSFPIHARDATDLIFRLRPYSQFAEYGGIPADLDFHFPLGYIVKPEIAWTTPSTSAYTLAGTGNLTPDADISDLDGNLVKVELYSRRLDTGASTTHLSIPVNPNSLQTLSNAFTAAGTTLPLNFAGVAGANTLHVLTLRATDAQGNVVESSRTLTRPPVSGSTSAPPEPSFTVGASEPFSTVRFWPTAYIRAEVVSPATRIHSYLDTSFSPSSPGSYTDTVALYKDIYTSNSARIWVRASDGSNHSAWIYCDVLITSRYG